MLLPRCLNSNISLFCHRIYHLWVIEGYSKRGGRRTKLDGGEITNDNLAVVRLCQLAYRFTQNIKPRLSFLSVDDTTPHITFHGRPAIYCYEVFGMCGKGVFRHREPHFSLGRAPSVSKALPQHYSLAATTKLSRESCGFERFMSA